MNSITASQYRSNVLFRLLAFLDNTGTQSFVLNKEVDADGHFLHPDAVFAETTAIAAILSASLRALRSNVHRLFKCAGEQQALLSAIGTGAVDPAVSLLDWTTWTSSASPTHAVTSTANSVDGPSAPEAAGEKTVDDGKENLTDGGPQSQPSATDAEGNARRRTSPPPINNAWSYLVCHPVSLVHYAEQVENELPIHLLVRLREVLGVAPLPSLKEGKAEFTRAAPAFFSTTPFVEQMLIDGLDEWMRSSPVEEVKRMILACGVQPTVLASAFENQQHQQQEEAKAERIESNTASSSYSSLPDSLVDFVVDVVFPVLSTAGGSSSSPPFTTATQSTTSTPTEGYQDWLLLSYEKNHEAIEVGEDDDADKINADCKNDVNYDANSNVLIRNGNNHQPRKLPRLESNPHVSHAKSEDEDKDGLGSWQPDDGEEVLTADNIDRYLRECPERIPKKILREKRRPISDAAITAFELENHYTAAELKKLIKDEVGAMTTEEASALMGTSISTEQITRAAKATRKAQFVEWILTAHLRATANQAGDKS